MDNSSNLSIEMRNINCGLVKRLESIFLKSRIEFQRENFVENSLLIGEMTVVFKLIGDISEHVKDNCKSVVRSIYVNGVRRNLIVL